MTDPFLSESHPYFVDGAQFPLFLRVIGILKKLVVAAGILALIVLAFEANAADPKSPPAPHPQAASIYGGSPDILETLDVFGEISPGDANAMVEKVKGINENQKIKAVLLTVDTPGGGAIASASLYAEIAKIKVPVVGWCNRLCASGGIYALMSPSIKYIVVRPETISGSVGVIMHSMRYNRLLDLVKVDAETYRSGTLKDAGNPTRAIEGPEKAYLQGIIDNLAGRFYAVIAKARPKITDWEAIKSARIFIGEEAVKIGLVDAVGDKEDAVKKAKELSGSKLIFTREELKRMSKMADGPTGGFYGRSPDLAERAADDLHWLVNMLQEIKSGSAVRFDYRMPYQF